MTHLKTTATQVVLAGKPVNILAASLSPSRQIIRAELSACFGIDSRQTQRQACGLELAAQYKTGETLM
jgi:Mn-dependent DtxR family transcriptional regulator